MSARIADPKPPRMTVDEFLVWYDEQPGRFELVDGEVVAMSPARARHGLTKLATQMALVTAVKRAGLPCEVFPDGLGVRASEYNWYEPDALVRCGAALDGDAIEAADPVIVVEVLSPSTRSVDTGLKFTAYFAIPSVVHYLVVDPAKRVVIHHNRTEPDLTSSRILRDGQLTLDPPRLELVVSDLFSTD